jgi:hypothetical protein
VLHKIAAEMNLTATGSDLGNKNVWYVTILTVMLVTVSAE